MTNDRSQNQTDSALNVFLEVERGQPARCLTEEGLIHHQLERLTPDEIASLSEPSTTRQGSSFTGMEARLAELLADWTWVQRRVETIELGESGQTRREISADFVYPAELAIPVRKVSDTVAEYAVPIALLRKGSLNSVSCKDEMGKSVPLLGSDQNSEIAYRAAVGLLGSSKAFLQLRKAIEDIQIGGQVDISASRARDLIKAAISDIVFTENLDAVSNHELALQRRQVVHRHNLLSNIALMFALKRDSQRDPGLPASLDCEYVADGIGFSHWQKGWRRENLQNLSIDDAAKFPSVLDTSLPVRMLVLGALKMLHCEDGRTVDYSVASRLEMFFNFLATLAFSYPLCVAVEYPTVDSSRIAASRKVINLSMDVQIADDDPEKKRSMESRHNRLDLLSSSGKGWSEYNNDIKRLEMHDLWVNRLRMVSFWLKRLGAGAVADIGRGVVIPFRFSTLSAASTHVEVVLPKNTKVKKAKAIHDPRLMELAGTDLTDSARAAIVKPTGVQHFYVNGTTAPRVMNYKLEPTKSKNADAKHGTFYQSQNHAHFNASRSPATPLESVQMTMQALVGPRLMGAQCFTALLALAGLVGFMYAPNGVSPSPKTLGTAEIAATATLAVTVFLVIFATGFFNRTAQLLHRAVNAQIIVYAGASALLVLLFYLTSRWPVPPRDAGTTIAMILIIPAGFLFATSDAAYKYVLRKFRTEDGCDPYTRSWACIRVKWWATIIFAVTVLLAVFTEGRFWRPLIGSNALVVVQALVFWVVFYHLLATLKTWVEDQKGWSEDEAERYLECDQGPSIARSFRKFNALTETGPWDAPYLSAEVAEAITGCTTLQEYLDERRIAAASA